MKLCDSVISWVDSLCMNSPMENCCVRWQWWIGCVQGLAVLITTRKCIQNWGQNLVDCVLNKVHFSHAAGGKEQLCLSLCDVIHPVVCPWQDPLPPTWFLGSSGNFKQLFFQKMFDSFFQIFFFTQNFFHSKFLLTSKRMPPLSYAFLDVSCYHEC